MINFIFIISLLSLLNPLSYFNNQDAETIGYKVNYRAAKMLEKKYGVNFCGVGMGAHEKIELLGLSFQYYEPIADINEARKLLISVSQDYYEFIANSEEAKPYLLEPFTPEKINLSLFMQTKDRGDVFYPNISIASFFGDHILFITKDKKEGYKESIEIEEPLQYALDIVEGRIEPPVYPELQN